MSENHAKFLLQLLHNKNKNLFPFSFLANIQLKDIYHVDNEEMFILKILDSHWVRTFFALFSIEEEKKSRISSFWRVLLLTVKSFFLLPQFKNNWLILFLAAAKFLLIYFNSLVFYLFYFFGRWQRDSYLNVRVCARKESHTRSKYNFNGHARKSRTEQKNF